MQNYTLTRDEIHSRVIKAISEEVPEGTTVDQNSRVYADLGLNNSPLGKGGLLEIIHKVIHGYELKEDILSTILKPREDQDYSLGHITDLIASQAIYEGRLI